MYLNEVLKQTNREQEPGKNSLNDEDDIFAVCHNERVFS